MKALNIFIIGGGKVGRNLIEALVKEEHDITLIDSNEKKIRDICAQYDIMGTVGNGASYRVLVDAGIQKADILIAVTPSDELNLLCCSVASQVSDCNTIARVRTPEYSEEVWYLRDKLGLSMVINPELESASEISRMINLPAALEVNFFARGEARLIKFRVKPDSALAGKSLPSVVVSSPVRLLFTTVNRNGEIFIPNGYYVFEPKDVVSFVTGRRDTIAALKFLDLYQNPLKSCIIIGGGNAGYYLGNQLINAGLDVTILEKNAERCESLSSALPKANIINGDGSDVEVLKEEGVAYTDAVIPYTGIDEVNIMLSLYIRKHTDAKVVTKISRPNLTGVIEDLDVGSIVHPSRITVDLILAYTRAKSHAEGAEIESLYHMYEDRVEAIEFAITKDSEAVNKPLSQLELNDNIVIASILRNGKIIFPTGTDVIKKGDSVMIVTTNFGYKSIDDILR